MRSFIKTHKRASSLDNSPRKSSNESPENRRNSQGSFGTELSYPSGYPPNNVLKQSSSFEPLHKLTSNKIFSSKLFKKSSNGKTSSSNTSPLLSRSDAETFAPLLSNTNNIPAIKGTRKHEWGDNDDTSESVILLNRTSMSSMSDTNQDTPDTEIVRIHPNSQQGSILSSQTSADRTPRLSLEEAEDVEDYDITKHSSLSRSQSLKKKRNRLARIHSHDDIMHLRSQSSFSSDLLGSGFSPIPEKSPNPSPLPKYERSPRKENNILDRTNLFDLRKISEASYTAEDESNFNRPFTGVAGGETIQITTSIKDSFVPSPETSHKIRFAADNVIPLSKAQIIENSASEADEDDSNEEDGEEESDSSSRFSFENGNDLCGRTASLKYYSTETNTPPLYVNDIYENDNFDDEMNYFDSNEEEDENMDHLYGGDNTALSGFAGMCTLSDDEFDRTNAAISQELSSHSSQSSKGYTERQRGFSKRDSNKSFEDGNDDYDPSNHCRSYHDIYNLSDEEEAQTINKKVTEPRKRKISDGTNKVTKYADMFLLSDDDAESGSQDEDFGDESRENDVKFNVNSERYGVEHTNLVTTQNHNLNPISFKSPSRFLDVLNVNHSPLAYKTPERNILKSPLQQPIKYHGVSSLLDNDIQGTMKNLYYIDETDEDRFLEYSAESEEYYLDEINGIPEDFEFSDDENIMRNLSPLSRLNRTKLLAFRRTHSYSDRPLGVLKDNTPLNYKLEIKNKTVTFFDHNSIHRSYSEPFSSSLLHDSRKSEDNCEDRILDNKTLASPVTPNSSFTKPSPSFTQNSSLSPIQESTTSSDASPKIL